MQRRIYVDTSVIGGCLDDEFAVESQTLLRKASNGDILLLISDVLIEELSLAPKSVQEVLEALPLHAVEPLEVTSEALELCEAYLAAEILTKSSYRDAEHVAVATVSRADLIVSWNFKHIVHVDKIRNFNAVNLANGYGLIDIRSPLEVI